MTKVGGFHPLGTMNVCGNHGNPSNSCSDISVWTKVVEQPTCLYFCHNTNSLSQHKETALTEPQTESSGGIAHFIQATCYRSCPGIAMAAVCFFRAIVLLCSILIFVEAMCWWVHEVDFVCLDKSLTSRCWLHSESLF